MVDGICDARDVSRQLKRFGGTDTQGMFSKCKSIPFGAWEFSGTLPLCGASAHEECQAVHRGGLGSRRDCQKARMTTGM